MPDVGAFIEDYFEACARAASGAPCAGLLKSDVVTQGAIYALPPDSASDEGEKLEFMGPDAGRHPINDIFDELLGWLRAQYTPNRLRKTKRAAAGARNMKSHIAMSNLLWGRMNKGDWPAEDRNVE